VKTDFGLDTLSTGLNKLAALGVVMLGCGVCGADDSTGKCPLQFCPLSPSYSSWEKSEFHCSWEQCGI
jgi:hypothetical protein